MLRSLNLLSQRGAGTGGGGRGDLFGKRGSQSLSGRAAAADTPPVRPDEKPGVGGWAHCSFAYGHGAHLNLALC